MTLSFSTLPSLPLPAPLRGIEAGSFAHRTVAVRIPEIGRRILAENDFPPETAERLQALIDELPAGKVRSLQDTNAPDWAVWERYLVAFLGQNWLEIPWFLAETYFYRRVLEATGYFQPGPGMGSDPYAYQKKQGLETSQTAIRQGCEEINAWLSSQGGAAGGLPADQLAQLVRMNLWGNQADLSMWPAGQGVAVGQDRVRVPRSGQDLSTGRPLENDNPKNGQTLSGEQRDHLLCDHAAQAAAYFLKLREKDSRVDILLDNAGLELVHDLLLAEALLGSERVRAVRLHAKPHPTFVSDAVIRDVLDTVEFLSGMGTRETDEVAGRLGDHLKAGRLQLREHFFWTSPLSMWEMPCGLRQELGKASLVISKGDANYRRMVGDRHWAYDTPITRVLDYMPTAVLLLRVSKSQVMIGLQPGQAEAMDKLDPQWMTNGKWGVIQLYRPVPRSKTQP